MKVISNNQHKGPGDGFMRGVLYNKTDKNAKREKTCHTFSKLDIIFDSLFLIEKVINQG